MEAYKQMMIIEYRELKERADKLATMLDKWDKGTLDFTPRKPLSEREKRGNEVLSDKTSDKRYRITLTGRQLALVGDAEKIRCRRSRGWNE